MGLPRGKESLGTPTDKLFVPLNMSDDSSCSDDGDFISNDFDDFKVIDEEKQARDRLTQRLKEAAAEEARWSQEEEQKKLQSLKEEQQHKEAVEKVVAPDSKA